MPIFRDKLHLGRKVPQMQTDDYSPQSVTREKLSHEVVEEIESKITTVDALAAVNTEKQRAERAEQKLENAIEAEKQRAIDYEQRIVDALDNERERAEGEEQTLQNHINDEQQRAHNAEFALGEEIEGLHVEKVPAHLLDSTELDAWQLVDKDGVPKGAMMVTYKDRHIEKIEQKDQKLYITYVIADGSKHVVEIDFKEFIVESEFDSKGFVVRNGVVYLKISEDTQTKNYLHFNDDGSLSLHGIEEFMKDMEDKRQATFEAKEAERQRVFEEKEATRDAANQAALDAAETLEEQGEKLSELGGQHKKIEEHGLWVTDKEGNAVFGYDKNGFDAAKISEHLKMLIKSINGIVTEIGDTEGTAFDGARGKLLEARIERISLIFNLLSDTKENGIWFTDANGYTSFGYDNDGFDAAKFSCHFKDKIKSISNELDVRIDSVAIALRDYISAKCAYWIDEQATPTSFAQGSYLDRKIATIPNGKSFIFVTDTHYWGDNRRDNNRKLNSQHSNHLIDYVRKRLGISKVVFGGDCFNTEPDKYQGAESLSLYADEFYSAFGKDGIYCIGNHDGNGFLIATGRSTDIEGITIPDSEIYNRTIKNIDDCISLDEDGISRIDSLSLSDYNKEQLVNWMKMHYTYDDENAKIRYIVIETCDIGYATCSLLDRNVYCCMALQFKWLFNALLNTPDGYDNVIIGHQLGDGEELSGYYVRIMEMITAYKNKKSVSIPKATAITNNALASAWWDSEGTGSHTYNFSIKKSVGKVVVLGGHYHLNAAYNCHYNGSTFTAKEVSIDSVFDNTSVLYAMSQCDRLTEHKDLPVGDVAGMELGTTTENAFDVVTITDDGVCFTRFGAGEDRMFNF